MCHSSNSFKLSGYEKKFEWLSQIGSQIITNQGQPVLSLSSSRSLPQMYSDLGTYAHTKGASQIKMIIIIIIHCISHYNQPGFTHGVNMERRTRLPSMTLCITTLVGMDTSSVNRKLASSDHSSSSLAST